MATASSIERVEFAHRRTVKDGRTVKELVSETEIRNEQNKIKIVTIGTANDRKTASILLVGETGAGKTTSLNALINVLIGVQFEDDFRYAVVDEMEAEKEKIQTQTEFVTGYLLYHKPGMPYECNFLIFDTPGLLKTKMEMQKRKIREQMEFFLQKNEFNYFKGNALRLNCLGFVMKAGTERTQDYVKEFITEFESLFGKDTESITNIIATFCGAEESCHDLCKLLKDMNVKYKDLFPIENPAMFSKDKSPSRGFWEITVSQYKRLVEDIMGEFTQLHLTQAMIGERLLLREGESKLKELIKSKIKDLQELERNKESQKNVDIKEVQTKPLYPGHHAHNCQKCKKTCFICCKLYFGYCFNSFWKCSVCSCSKSEHQVENKEILVNEEHTKEQQKMSNDDNEKDKNTTIEIQRLIGRINCLREILKNKSRLMQTQETEDYLNQLRGELEKDMPTPGTSQSAFDNAMKDLKIGHK